MIQTSARLLQLLGLLQGGQEWTAPRLGAYLGIEPRTVRRDIERLRELGYPVQARRGVLGGYRLGDRGSLPPLLLDAQEALAVAVGLRSAAVGSVAGADEAADRALGKLEKVLPAGLRGRLAAMDAGLVTLPGGTAPVDGDHLTSILRACDTCVRLRFDYRSGAGDSSRRDTEPFRLVQAGRRWYLVAFDLHRHDWRTYRVDRMSELSVSTFTFTPRDPDLDAARLVSRSVSSAPYRYQARVLVRSGVAELVDLVPATVGMVVAAGEGQCLLLTGSESLRSIALHLISLNLPMVILDPPALVEAMGDLARQVTTVHQRSLRSLAEPAQRHMGDLG